MTDALTIGWIGIGRMGSAMAERLLKAGHSVKIWNRTRAKAEPLAALGATIVDKPTDLASVDVLFTMVSTGNDVDRCLLRRQWRRAARQGRFSEDPRRVLVDRDRGQRDGSRPGEVARRRDDRSAGLGQRQMRQGRQAERRRVRSEGDLRHRQAADRSLCRPRRRLCRRGRTRPLLQDRPQRHARRGDPEPRRGHDPRREGRRFAPGVSRVRQQQRDGLDLHPLQVAGAGQSRLDDDLHADAASQGSRPRPRRCPRNGCADAGDGSDPRGAAGPYRRGDSSSPTRRRGSRPTSPR